MNIIDLLFPKLCAGCGGLGQYLCPSCVLNIRQTKLVCPFCERLAHGGAAHPLCKRKYGLDGLWSLGVYSDTLQKAIQKLKYRWVRELAEVLVDLMVEYWARYNPEFIQQIRKDQGKNWQIVPVPLHKFRQNWRGFNQASLLGQLLSKRLDLDYLEGLKRIRNTKPQIELKAWERKQNIKGAFTLNCKLLPINCLLIDDVWTTGATLKECCYVLKKGGAKKVWAITLAR